jgi:hypothetical protein
LSISCVFPFSFSFQIRTFNQFGHGRHEKCVQNFDGNPEGGDYFEDVGVDERIILKWILEQ